MDPDETSKVLKKLSQGGVDADQHTWDPSADPNADDYSWRPLMRPDTSNTDAAITAIRAQSQQPQMAPQTTVTAPGQPAPAPMQPPAMGQPPPHPGASQLPPATRVDHSVKKKVDPLLEYEKMMAELARQRAGYAAAPATVQATPSPVDMNALMAANAAASKPRSQ